MTGRQGIIFTGEDQVIYGGFTKIPDPAVPRPAFFARLLRYTPWRIDVRLRPPPGRVLREFGDELGELFGLQISYNNDPENRAIWIVGVGWYRDEGAALAATARLLEQKLGANDAPLVRACQIAATEMEKKA